MTAAFTSNLNQRTLLKGRDWQALLSSTALFFESDRISTDSGADTSDDEDLVQEVEIFYRNLKNWVAAEEKRKKKKGEKRIKTSQQADICTPSLQAKKASRNCDDGSCCPG